MGLYLRQTAQTSHTPRPFLLCHIFESFTRGKYCKLFFSSVRSLWKMLTASRRYDLGTPFIVLLHMLASSVLRYRRITASMSNHQEATASTPNLDGEMISCVDKHLEEWLLDEVLAAKYTSLCIAGDTSFSSAFTITSYLEYFR